MSFSPITINIPIEIDAGAFATSTTVQGETVTYNKVHLPLLYMTNIIDPTVQNMRDTFQFKESDDQTLVTVDISGGAIGSFENGTAVVKALFKAALEGTDIRNAPMTAGVIYADGSTRNTVSDPLKFYADKDTHTEGIDAGSTLKAYLLEYLHNNLSSVIGLAATTGTIDINLSRDNVAASEIISSALALQLCGSGNTEQGIAAAALRQNIYEQMFTLAPERFQESTFMRREPAANGIFRDLPFQENDTMAFLVTFKFPASQISAPVVANAVRTGEENVYVDTGSKISVVSAPNATSALQSLIESFPDCTVMMRVQLTDGKRPPAAPTDLQVTPGDQQVILSFTAGADNGSPILNYKYSIDDGETYVALTPEDSVSPITITNLVNGTEYQIRIRGVNAVGDGVQSEAVTATTAAPPDAPTGLSTTLGDRQVTISFTAGADNGAAITNYKYSLNGGSYTELSPADGTSPITITGLTVGTSYTIRLKAMNNAGDGAESSAVTVTAVGIPTAPTSLVATRGDRQATIAFTASASNGRTITNYKYSVDNGATYTAFSPSVIASPVTIPSLLNGTTYQIKLRAVNAIGDGDQSDAVGVTPNVVPGAPTGLTATFGDKQVTLSFTAGVNNGTAITNYKYSIDNGVTYTAFSPVDTSSPVTITGLTNGTTYQIKLRAVNNAGDGIESAMVSSTPAAPPAAPTGLVATRGDKQATIAFTAGANNGAEFSNYKYSIDGGVTYTALSPADVISPVTIPSLMNGTTYLIRLRAVNIAGDGAESLAVSVTPAGVPTAPSSLTTTIGDGSVSISFTEAMSNGATITNYKYSLNNGTTYTEFDPAVTASPVFISGLTNGTNYQIKLLAVNNVGDGIASAAVSVTPYGLPFAPTNLTSAAGDGQVAISFTAGGNNGSAITNYKYSVDDGVTYTAFDPADATSPVTITGLLNNQIYPVRIRAVNVAGDGAESVTISAATAIAPAAPTNLSSTAGDRQITISFAAGANNGATITNYKYSIDGGATYIALYPADPISPITITGLENSRTYDVRLRAVNNAGESVESAMITASTAYPPAAPTNLSSTAGDGQVTISFTAGASNGASITNYKYSVDGGATYTALNPVNATSPITITGLENNRTYDIKLRAINAAGDGLESAMITAATAYPPAAPTNLSSTPGDGQVTISFTAGANNGAVITNYKYSVDGGATYTVFDPVDTTSPVTITGLENNRTYDVKLRAVNAVGDGLESAMITAATAYPPAAPTNLSSTAGDGQVSISFTAGANNGAAITNYKYSVDGGATYMALNPVDATSPITITGLENSRTYDVKLRAVNVAGDGLESAMITATTAYPPAAPTNLSSTAGDGQVTISFTAGANNGAAITNYKYSVDGGATYTAFDPVDTTSPVTITGLTNNTIYQVKLRAVNTVGDGEQSIVVSAPTAAPPAAPTDLISSVDNSKVTIYFTPGVSYGAPITNYKYSIDNGLTYAAFNPIDNTSPVTITGLTNGTTYQIKLRAVNTFGDGTESETIVATPKILAWTQKGANINGETFQDNSGWSVSLSANGSTVAIGAPKNDGNGLDKGQVRVYDWNSSSWVQRGADIDGETSGDQSGFAVSISDDGTVVAIGAPYNAGNGTNSGHVRVYAWNGSAWIQRGIDIDGENWYDESGYSLSLSANGSIVAIGARLNDSNGSNTGHVRIYAWNGSTWIKRGTDIDGEAVEDNSGYSVCLSADGSIVAIGAIYNDGTSGNANDNRGHVRIYAWNGSSWIKRGADIDGEYSITNTVNGGDNSGFSVSLSNDGSIVAIGAPRNSDVNTATGQVRVYAWNGSAWIKRGADIDGQIRYGGSGYSVSLSADGSIVALGGPYSANGTEIGRVSIFEWNGSAWIQKGLNIDGESTYNESGWSVSLSANGLTVAIGSPRINSRTGHVRIFEFI